MVLLGTDSCFLLKLILRDFLTEAVSYDVESGASAIVPKRIYTG